MTRLIFSLIFFAILVKVPVLASEEFDIADFKELYNGSEDILYFEDSKRRVDFEEFLNKYFEFLRRTYARSAGIIGDIINDAGSFISNKFIDKKYFTKAEDVFQCTAALPISLFPKVLGPLTQLKHTWLRIGDDSYGLPTTLKGTYFGGDAVIFSPDPYVGKGRINEYTVKCTPIFRPKKLTMDYFYEKIHCIADKLSHSKDLENDDWLPIVDYHALKNNCFSAVRFITECAFGRTSQAPNYSVGSRIKKTERAYTVDYLGSDHKETSTYGKVCLRARRDCGLDEKVR